jgi:uncharacterized protein YjbI with pentapeptide repeats
MNDKPTHVDWRTADMRGANFAGLSLQHADLRAANLSGCNFTGCNLSYADLRGADIRGATFQNANMYGAKMQGVEGQGTDFRGADLRQANLGGAYLEGAMMPGITAEKAAFQQALAANGREVEEKVPEKGLEKTKGERTGEMNDLTLKMAMIDRFYHLLNDATAEVIELNKTYKPPCAQYVAVLQIFENVLHEALKRQRETMLRESRN